jgi:hypothetical protein
MAVQEDYKALEELASRRRTACLDYHKILLCSPSSKQLSLIKKLFTYKQVSTSNIDTWDFSQPCLTKTDLLIIQNVFHYSPDPELWFENCIAGCKELWVQDLMIRPRGPNGLGEDGDKMRYRFHQPVPETFDLKVLEDRMHEFWFYDAGTLRAGLTCINFITAMRGDL